MRGVNAAPAGVARAEYLGEHPGMRWRLELIPMRVLGRHRAPRHRRHEQIAVAHVIDQGFNDGLGPKPASAQWRDRAVNDQDTILRHAEALQDRHQRGGLSARRHRSARYRGRLRLDLLDQVEATIDVAEREATELR